MRYYNVEVGITTEVKPSYFTGSMLRGAMGYSLKKVTCINPSYQCEECFTKKSCLYYHFYEEENSIHDYRFDIELGSGKFDFGLYLFAEATESLAYVLSALQMTLMQTGLTKENYKFNEFTIGVNGQEVFDGKVFNNLDILVKEFKVDKYYPNVKVRLRTPLRMKKNNKLLRDNVDIEDILRSISQRKAALTRSEKVFKLDYEPSYITTVNALKYASLVRKSSRQKQHMNMDGIVGEIAILGLDERSYGLLKLGEIIGVGKQTVMGLGRIEVVEFT